MQHLLKTLAVVFTFSILLLASGYAANWEYISEDATGRYYLDADSIETVGDTLHLTLKIALPPGLENRKTFLDVPGFETAEFRMNLVANCVTQSLQMSRLTFFDPNGEYIEMTMSKPISFVGLGKTNPLSRSEEMDMAQALCQLHDYKTPPPSENQPHKPVNHYVF